MHFRIAGLRIIPLLLQLIIRRSAKTRCRILILRIKQGGRLRPFSSFPGTTKRRPTWRLFKFLKFGKGFVREEEAECLLRRDLPEGDEL